MDLPISRCAVMRPATETFVPSGNTPDSNPLRASLHARSGVNLFLNGSMPFARKAVSLALRCSISEFVSSDDMRRKIEHEFARKPSKQTGNDCESDRKQSPFAAFRPRVGRCGWRPSAVRGGARLVPESQHLENSAAGLRHSRAPSLAVRRKIVVTAVK